MVELLFLGSGDAFSGGRDYSSTLMNSNILVDPSPTCVPRLKEHGFDFKGLDMIFITHLHGDHILGYPFIVLEYTFRVKRDSPLRVICPTGGKKLLTELIDTVYDGIPHKENLEIEFFEVSEEMVGNVQSVKNINFTPYRTAHGDILSFGYLIENVGFSGDSGPCEGISKLASSSRVMINEMSQRESSYPNHFGIDDIIELRKSMSIVSTLLVNHHYGPGEDDIEKLSSLNEGEVIVVSDMQKMTF